MRCETMLRNRLHRRGLLQEWILMLRAYVVLLKEMRVVHGSSMKTRLVLFLGRVWFLYAIVEREVSI